MVLRVGANLVRVHANHGDLDRASEVVVVVAQMIGGCLECFLLDGNCVIDDLVEHWLSGCHCCLVWDHIEVKFTITLLLYETRINNGTRTRIKIVLMLLGKESVLNVAINQAVYYFRLVPLSSVLKHVCDYFNFMLLYLSSHGGTTHAISIDNHLFRK